MDNARLTPRRWVLMYLLALLSMLFMSFLLRVLLSVQAGMGIEAALRAAYLNKNLWVSFAIAFLVLSLFFLISAIFMERQSTVGGRFPILRAVVTVWLLPTLLLMPVLIVYILATGAWENSYWIMVVMWLNSLAVLLYFWVVKPDPERLQAFETRDFSRVNDERFQAVQGRSAVTALNILIIPLFFGGILYDVLITHMWPFRSFAEMILIVVVWSLASWWWNRKL